MKKSNTYLSILMAGLLAAAGVHAQSTSAAGSSDGPPKAGEASTQTSGVPNAATSNSPVTEAPISTKDAIRQDASGMGAASATTSVPGKAGEASTTVKGQPNVDPANPVVGKNRAEVKSEVAMKRAQTRAERAAQSMGNSGNGPGVPATAPAGTPSVFQGGTPQ